MYHTDPTPRPTNGTDTHRAHAHDTRCTREQLTSRCLSPARSSVRVLHDCCSADPLMFPAYDATTCTRHVSAQRVSCSMEEQASAVNARAREHARRAYSDDTDPLPSCQPRHTEVSDEGARSALLARHSHDSHAYTYVLVTQRAASRRIWSAPSSRRRAATIPTSPRRPTCSRSGRRPSSRFTVHWRALCGRRTRSDVVGGC